MHVSVSFWQISLRSDSVQKQKFPDETVKIHRWKSVRRDIKQQKVIFGKLRIRNCKIGQYRQQHWSGSASARTENIYAHETPGMLTYNGPFGLLVSLGSKWGGLGDGRRGGVSVSNSVDVRPGAKKLHTVPQCPASTQLIKYQLRWAGHIVRMAITTVFKSN